jgi:phosphate starvation-inducible PhoH-like protein
MPRSKSSQKSSKEQQKSQQKNQQTVAKGGSFHIEFLNTSQKLAWAAFRQHDVLFMIGPAGTAKSFLSCAFAVEQLLNNKNIKNIVLTRPIVEAGESLGFLPGDFNEKVDPYIAPMYDALDLLVGKNSPQRDRVNAAIKVVPLAYMRGHSFRDSICILDEAQNSTKGQLKLFLSRFCTGSKVIVNGDPLQSDLYGGKEVLIETVEKLKGVSGIGVVEFKADSIVRHPLVGRILEKLEE